MKNKKYIIIGLAVIVIILIVALVIFFSKKDNEDVNNMILVSENNVTNENAEDNTSIVDQDTSNQNVEEIENMKNEINATGNTDIYYVDEEYDGRKILQVKPDVQFDVDLAGIIKNTIPEENEISELIEKAPTDNGVWISEESRESFSTLLKNNNINDFTISDDGYLQINNSENNDMANKLINMINSNNLYIINITGIAYERDYISGEITEYPFEDMDPTQAVEPYQKENKIILEVTTNKMQELTESEILDAITSY